MQSIPLTPDPSPHRGEGLAEQTPTEAPRTFDPRKANTEQSSLTSHEVGLDRKWRKLTCEYLGSAGPRWWPSAAASRDRQGPSRPCASPISTPWARSPPRPG